MPVGIASNVLQYEPDLNKREDYAINLESDNFENKLHQAVDTTGLDDSGCLNGCLYMDADDARKYLTTKFVSELANHKNSGTLINLASKAPVLSYQTKSYITPLNNWENPDYFTAAFPTLFLFGASDYLI